MTQVPMPGVGYHCASEQDNLNNHQQKELTDPTMGPDWFFGNRVRPLVAEGVTTHVFHAPFGKLIEYPYQIPGAISDTGDMMWGMYTHTLNGSDPAARERTISMRDHVISLASKEGMDVQLYFGTPRCPSMNAWYNDATVNGLSNSMKVWKTRLYDNVAPFRKHRNISIIVDAIGTNYAQWGSSTHAAYEALTQIMGGDSRIYMEPPALPRDEFKHLWGRPSFILEKQWTKYSEHHGEATLGKLTRFLGDLKELNGPDADWPTERGGIVGFVVDCFRKGHRAIIGEHIPRNIDMTFTQIRDEAQAIVDKEMK